MQLFTKTPKVKYTVNKALSTDYTDTVLSNIIANKNVCVTKDFTYTNINGDQSQSVVAVVRNIHIDDSYTASFYKPEVLVNRLQFESLSEFRVLSYPNKPCVLFGKYFSEPKNSNLVEVTASKINGYSVYFNFDQIIEYTNYSYDNNWFIYFENLLITARFNPYYEHILYPLTGNRVQPYLYTKFELENNEQTVYVVPPECKDDVYVIDWDLLLDRPKFLFSTNGENWIKYDFENNQWINVLPDNGSYITYDEFLTKGMTYTDYLNIPDTAFSNSTWYVMTNNFIPGFVLKPTYFADYVGGLRFITFDVDIFEQRLTVWTL